MLEGERGLVRRSTHVDWSRITPDRLGSYYKVTENGYKIHACCRHGHVTIDETLRMTFANDLQPDRIRRVVVKLSDQLFLHDRRLGPGEPLQGEVQRAVHGGYRAHAPAGRTRGVH